ncbi:putative RNA-binding protein [Lachnellula cervina]|uniref:Putative RNA-binding protein n=1 Tax=Lachnellula cervina TaxID=1316786 RepID=A0A7D8YPW1_9HELO|nr:putative RNA-binding protein [Lachnellula cervina]
MSYPPPPGLPPASSSVHPSLPARPPPSTLPPRQFQNGASRPSAPGFAPRSVASAQPQPSYNNYPPQQSYPQQQHQQQQYSAYPPQTQPQDSSYGAAPQIRNPFAPPTAGPARQTYEEDPDMAAQIAQWQSAYAAPISSAPQTSTSGYTGPVRRDPSAPGQATSSNAAPLGGRGEMSSAAMSSAANVDSGVANIVSDSKDPNQKTVVRSGGGTTWTDGSLLEWDPSHFRLFVGNLAGEVTDESLYKAFSRWPSIQKARVIRDKRTTKSKGYGFVAFSDGDEFFSAAREMQGKYIGSHPVLLRRSTTEIKAVTPRDNRKGKGNKGKNNKGKNGDKTGAGVQKPGSKTKGGLKVLG